MTTKQRLTDDEALAIIEDESTVWHRAPDNGNRQEISTLILVRDHVDSMILAAVARARREGQPWIAIGHALGVTGEAARKKYTHRI